MTQLVLTRKFDVSAYMIRPPRVEERLVPPHRVVPLPRPVLLLMMVVGDPRFEKSKVLLSDCLPSLGSSAVIFLLLVLLVQVNLVWGPRAFVSRKRERLELN